jgi:acyl-CoA reductase-like NAD-dependent aldehyde dehydrogenase
MAWLGLSSLYSPHRVTRLHLTYSHITSHHITGQVLPSERQDHTMLEVWNPLGQVGIISAFNFPCAVAGWNTSVSMVSGNTQVRIIH